MLIVVFLTFAVCWTPHEILLVYNAHAPDQFAQVLALSLLKTINM